MFATRVVPARPLVCFLHIMKTGGTSLSSAMVGACGGQSDEVVVDVFIDDVIRFDPQRLERMRYLAGHLPFETTELLPPGTITATVLRDPVDRSLSHFAELLKNPGVLSESPSFCLEEFLESPRWRNLNTNYQARQLAHRIGLTDPDQPEPQERYRQLGPPFPSSSAVPLQSYFDDLAMTMSDDELAERAMANLARVDVVGVIDHLDRAASLLLEHLCADDDVELSRLNVSPVRHTRHELPPAVVASIEARNQVDRMLFAEASRRARPLDAPTRLVA